MPEKRIFYVLSDNQKPSWGVGIIYHHVSLLKQAGYDAYVLYTNMNNKIEWLDINAPIQFIESCNPDHTDILVMPEFMASLSFVKDLCCRKILFVQGLSLLFFGSKNNFSHYSFGFEHAMIIMPHMKSAVEKYTGLPTKLIPPFIADYFFKPINTIHKREKIILMFPKQQQFEYSLIRQIISKTVSKSDKILSRLINDNWRIVEIMDYSHHEVAELMSRAAFLITTNTFEAFNTAVPEAMASGCINVCYEAVGPADYLVDGENAFVFQNNEAIALAEKVVDLIENYDQFEEDLTRMRLKAYNTASEYSKENMQTQLLDYFSSL